MSLKNRKSIYGEIGEKYTLSKDILHLNRTINQTPKGCFFILRLFRE